MLASSLNHLKLPSSKTRDPEIAIYSTDGMHILEGALIGADGNWTPILKGVPIFLEGELAPDLSAFATRHGLAPRQSDRMRASGKDQAKTTETFSDKWTRFRSYGLEPAHQDFLFGWYCKKLGVETIDDLKRFYGRRRRILECGPGSGFNTRFMAKNCAGEVFSLDISEAAFVTFNNTRDLANCTVVQADLMHAPFADGYFDFIIADGVLHHTPDTRAAVEALYRKLAPGGQFFFYIYRRMGAARAFSDAHIRAAFTKLSPEECYAACEGLTELGRELSRLGARIRLEKPIPTLGIPAGEHDVQRLLYYNFVKCFWNEAFDFETNNMVNFDWYHPHNAWQHTKEEVETWLRDLGAEDWRFNDANPNGLSVLLTKPA